MPREVGRTGFGMRFAVALHLPLHQDAASYIGICISDYHSVCIPAVMGSCQPRPEENKQTQMILLSIPKLMLHKTLQTFEPHLATTENVAVVHLQQLCLEQAPALAQDIYTRLCKHTPVECLVQMQCT